MCICMHYYIYPYFLDLSSPWAYMNDNLVVMSISTALVLVLIPFSSKQKWDPLEKWLTLRLGQEKFKMHVEHLVLEQGSTQNITK